jgi:carboxyl-terminal processing protease
MKIYLIVVLSFIHFSVFSQSKKVKATLDTVIVLMKKHSYNAKNVNWEKVTTEAYRLAANTKRPEQLGNSISYLFQQMQDYHGSFRYKKQIFRWKNNEVEVKETEPYTNAFARKDNRFFTTRMKNVGYMRIPTTLQEMAEERTQALQDSLCKLLEENPKGIIFDLRLNGGGDKRAMTMGVSNILEYGFVNPYDEIRSDGYYQLVNGSKVNVNPFKETCERNHKDIPIVVIIGPWTASSAEMLAIILKNRPNTILLGEPTAGWISVVDGMKVDKNSHINLSIDYPEDINHVVYKSKIQPGVLVEGGDNFFNLGEDKKIVKAIEWINSK